MAITVTPRSIAILATAIDFHLPHGWSDDLGQKVVDAAAVRVGSVEQLRDRFAMAALQGAIASDHHTRLDHFVSSAREWADCAYALADAMLASRGVKA